MIRVSIVGVSLRPNPVTGAGQYPRNFSRNDFLDEPSIEHRDLGGYYQARFAIRATIDLAEELIFAGAMMEAHFTNEYGGIDWEGFVSAVEVRTGGAVLRTDVGGAMGRGMTNRVWTRYREKGAADPTRSGVFNSVESQDLYGVKSNVLSGGVQVSTTEANQIAQRYLQENTWPFLSSVQITPGRRLEAEMSVSIDCLGWWHTLHWNPFNQTVNITALNSSDLVEDIVTDPDIGQFVASSEIEANATQVDQEIDIDRPGGDLIETYAQMGTTGLESVVAGFFRPGRIFEFRTGARTQV